MQKPPTDIVIKDKRPGFIEFETGVHITGTAPPGSGSQPPKKYNAGEFGFPPGASRVASKITHTIETSEQEYQARAAQLPQTIENELAATRLEGPTHPVPPIESIVRELGVLNRLWTRKQAEYAHKTAIANSYFGYDPIGRPDQEILRKGVTLEKPFHANSLGMQAWIASYKAAYDARLLSQTIHSLNQRSINLQQTLANLQAAEQARIAAEQEAQRVAAEQARIKAQAEARAHAQEQARLAALAEAERMAAEQARIAAEAAAQYIAAERARQEAEAEVQRQAEMLRLENERQAQEQALREATGSLNAGNSAGPFRVSGAAAANGPVFVVGAGTLALDTATALAIRTALRSAAATAITALAATVGTASGAVIVVGAAAVVYYALRDTKDPYALSVPLSDLTTFDDDQLRTIARANGEFELPVALGSRAVDNTTEFSVASTTGTTVPRKVPVRLATFDPALNLYRTENADAQSPGMTWTPIVSPGNASTAVPVQQPDTAPYTGATATPLEGRIDPNPDLDLFSFGGEIYVFPMDSGIPPQFVMLRDRRDDPGTGNGFGEPFSGIWLGSDSEGNGVAIPSQIADKLRGRDFPNFRAFREALWKAVASDPELSEQFRASNVEEMKNGRAPFARKNDRLGGQVKFELHHVNHVSKGGEVYNVDNIRAVTPKQHSVLHKGDK